MKRLRYRQYDADILIVQSDLNQSYTGHPLRFLESLPKREIPLGIVEIGAMILTHPERFISEDDLWIDCLGDVHLDEDGEYGAAPRLGFQDGRLIASYKSFDRPEGFYDATSGVVTAVYPTRSFVSE